MPTRSTSKTPTAKPASGKASTSRPKRKSTVKPSPVPLPTHKYLSGNALVCGDNLDILKDLPDGCVDLIYLDPPFNSNHNYVAAFGDKGRVDTQLRDIWRWTVETGERLPAIAPRVPVERGQRGKAGERGHLAYGGVFDIHGAAAGGVAPGPEVYGQHLPSL